MASEKIDTFVECPLCGAQIDVKDREYWNEERGACVYCLDKIGPLKRVVDIIMGDKFLTMASEAEKLAEELLAYAADVHRSWCNYCNAQDSVCEATKGTSYECSVISSRVAIAAALEAKDKEIERLKEELEYERMRLAACGVAAMANTEKTVADRLPYDSPYYSASYDDVCRAVDREMSLRAQLKAERIAGLKVGSEILDRISYSDLDSVWTVIQKLKIRFNDEIDKAEGK